VKPPSFARNVNRLKPVDANNSSVPHPLGPLNLGVRPLSRALLPELEHNCELGLVYNELSKQCDAPENVPECKDYYAFLEDGDENKSRK